MLLPLPIGRGKAPVNLGGKPMKELYTKPMSQIDEFKTYDEVLTASYTGGNTGIDHGTDLD